MVSAPALPLSRSCHTPKVINPSVMRTIAICGICPCFATISLVPYSEGHKPKRNENNSYLSRSCHTPKVINPSVMRTIAVVHVSAPALPLSRSCQTPSVMNPSLRRTIAVVSAPALLYYGVVDMPSRMKLTTKLTKREPTFLGSTTTDHNTTACDV